MAFLLSSCGGLRLFLAVSLVRPIVWAPDGINSFFAAAPAAAACHNTPHSFT